MQVEVFLAVTAIRDRRDTNATTGIRCQIVSDIYNLLAVSVMESPLPYSHMLLFKQSRIMSFLGLRLSEYVDYLYMLEISLESSRAANCPVAIDKKWVGRRICPELFWVCGACSLRTRWAVCWYY